MTVHLRSNRLLKWYLDITASQSKRDCISWGNHVPWILPPIIHIFNNAWAMNSEHVLLRVTDTTAFLQSTPFDTTRSSDSEYDAIHQLWTEIRWLGSICTPENLLIFWALFHILMEFLFLTTFNIIWVLSLRPPLISSSKCYISRQLQLQINTNNNLCLLFQTNTLQYDYNS